MTHNTIPGALRPLLGLLVIGLVATGCTFATAKTAEIGVGCDQFAAQKSITQTTEMSVGDQVKVTLCSNPSTGFAWQEPEISDAGVVSLVDKSFSAPVAGESPAVGAAGTDSHHPQGDRQGREHGCPALQPAVARRNVQRMDLHPDGDGPVAPASSCGRPPGGCPRLLRSARGGDVSPVASVSPYPRTGDGGPVAPVPIVDRCPRRSWPPSSTSRLRGEASSSVRDWWSGWTRASLPATG